MTPVAEVENITPERFAAEIATAHRPVVMRGLARDWPAVQAPDIAAYLASFDRGAPVDVMIAQPEAGGRFFYSGDMRGFNFAIRKGGVRMLLDQIAAGIGDPAAPSLYAGAAAAVEHLPGFAEANKLPLPTPGAVPRVWIGTASIVPTHYDLSDNVAVVVAGRRRVTLFPPQATPHLYVGPLNNTPAGQPVSMVDIRAPNLDRYPDYPAALAMAQQTVLEPGDAMFIPTLWWHDIQALDGLNVLVNYWYRHDQDGAAFLAFVHALLGLRDLPAAEREGWRAWFDHFIFSADPHKAAAHLPLHAQGIQGPASQSRAQAIRQFLMRALSGR